MQYKVADEVVRQSAGEWSLFKSSYFRFPIYPAQKSPQHNLLKDLSSIEPFVYYCSSAFSDYSTYITLHQNKQISSNSAFFPVRKLPRNSGMDNHDIVFKMKPPNGYWCSTPEEISVLSGWEDVLFDIKQHVQGLGSLSKIPSRVLNNLISVLKENEVMIDDFDTDLVMFKINSGTEDHFRIMVSGFSFISTLLRQ